MTTTTSGKWVSSGIATSQEDRDFFSGVKASTDLYSANEFEFGFSAVEVHIVNQGSNALAIQWLRLKGEDKDSGIVPGSGSLVFRCANKTGISVRSETSGSSSNFYVIAIG